MARGSLGAPGAGVTGSGNTVTLLQGETANGPGGVAAGAGAGMVANLDQYLPTPHVHILHRSNPVLVGWTSLRHADDDRLRRARALGPSGILQGLAKETGERN